MYDKINRMFLDSDMFVGTCARIADDWDEKSDIRK